jgi:iron complex transport system permease protein
MLDKNISQEYRVFIQSKVVIGLLLLTLVVLFGVYSINVGSYPISPGKLLTLLMERETDDIFHHIFWSIRLPRTFAAIIAGAGLGLAGVIMQNILRNPLASPFTLGVSQGAAFGAAFAIIVLGGGQLHQVGNEAITFYSPYLIVIFAFLGSLVTVFSILLLSVRRDITPESLILAGVALSSFFGAATMLLQYFASDMQIAATIFWTFGDLGKARWNDISLMVVALILSFTYFFWNSWCYNALQWGEETAEGLGVDVKRLRLLGMVISSFVASVAIAFLGIIGFIGLVSPHIMRIFVGNDYRFLIPYSAILGGLLLLLSDILARTIMAPVVLPVGILTSFSGAPFFLYLLIKRRGVMG